MGGEVASLNVREGDRVAAGQVLLEIWNQDLKAQLQLAEAEKTAAVLRSEEACKLATGAERELKRLRRLQADKLVSEEQVDRMQTDFDVKHASCAAARASVAVSDSRIRVAASALERTIVRAPFNGVVAEVNAELGEYVTPSPLGIQTLPAVDLLDLSCLYVSAPIDEVDAPPITTGMQACLSLDAFPERRCGGTVSRIAPYVQEREKQARTVEVEVVLSDPQAMAGLLPGYSADIEIILDRREQVLRIPTEAVLEENQVFRYDPATGTLHTISFERGLSNWNFTEVTAGLAAGDQIVVSIGREGVQEGARVIPEVSAEP
jgi:HlyD family secretion protein